MLFVRCLMDLMDFRFQLLSVCYMTSIPQEGMPSLLDLPVALQLVETFSHKESNSEMATSIDKRYRLL